MQVAKKVEQTVGQKRQTGVQTGERGKRRRRRNMRIRSGGTR